jgi:hypothetical protein
MWERLHRFSRLNSAARRLFLRAFILLPLVSLSLRFRGFRATQATLQKRLDATNASRLSTPGLALAPDVVPRTVQMVQAAVRHGFGSPNCLEISLTLWWLLARQDAVSTIRIGTRRVDSRLEAHAWVECGGIPLNEFEHPHYHYAPFDAAFPSLPESGPNSS